MPAIFLALFFFLGPAFSNPTSFGLPDKTVIVIGCTIYNPSGAKIKSYPGRFCIFLDDGSIVSSTATTLRLINPDDTVRWEIPGNYPRHLNISNDGKRILTTRSALEKGDGEIWRQDELMVIDLDGKILAQRKASELLPLKETWAVSPIVYQETEARIEKSHFNSIYEIPALKGKHDPRLKEGHIIANSVFLGALVLTPDLKTVVAHFPKEELNSGLVHDVQVMPEGKILFFNNRLRVPSGLRASGAHIYDPQRKKFTYTFKADPPEIFYSDCCGSVQIISEKYLLLAGFQGSGFFIEMKSGKIVKQFSPSFEMNSFGGQNIFLMKALNLEGFLAKRKL